MSVKQLRETPTRLKPAKLRSFRQQWMLWAMAMPALLLMLVFNYLPMIGLVMAFQDLDFEKGIFTSPFVGLRNFRFLFATSDAWIITRNTVVYNVVFIVVNMFLAVTLALAINELTNKTFSKVVQTIFIMPYFLSMVVVGMVVFGFLNPTNGYVNKTLQSLGMETISWYNDKKPWPVLFVFLSAWKSVGYSSVIYTAVISGISKDYYEAAALDGASRLQQMRYITLPHLKTIICINLIRSAGSIFRSDFGLFYTVTRNSGALYDVTNTLDVYIYNGLTNGGSIGMTTAAGFYQSIVGLFLVLFVNWVVKKMDSDSAMF